MLLAYQVSNYALPFILTVSAVFAVATALATFFISRSIYRTQLPTRQAETFQKNYEAERVRADLAERERDKLRDAQKVWEGERASLTLDYSQLSQLFAAKSIILENLVPIYGSMAVVAEAGRLKDYLEAIQTPVRHTGDLHRGTRDLDPESPHKTKG